MFGQVLHKIQRNQNHAFNACFRAGNRFNPFGNTLSVLEDPKSGRVLYLIGTTNSSTLLANRTKDLVKEKKPDSIFVQTNETWWSYASQLNNVTSQEELNNYNPLFRKAYDFQIEGGVRNFRNSIFWLRLYPWLFQLNWIKQFNDDFHPFIPGLEMKYAIEEAQKHNSKVVFGGLAINNSDLLALKTETRMNVIPVFWRFYQLLFDVRWYREYVDHQKALTVLGGESYAESVDQYRAAWYIKLFEKIAPYQKRILVDKKEDDLFYDIFKKLPGKTLVAVVNQWHMEGIEHRWRHVTDTQKDTEPINPIGDMDLEALYEDELVNDYLRTFTSRLAKSEPASWRSYITQYYKDCQEYERFRHVSFESWDDHHMYHGLPYDLEYDYYFSKLPADKQVQAQKKEHKHHH